MFDLFDVNQNGHIEFGEFIRSLAIFHPKTPKADKIKCKKYKLCAVIEIRTHHIN